MVSAMAKKSNHPNKPVKRAKSVKPKAGGTGKARKQAQKLPKPRVKATQVDVLVALLRALNRRLQTIEQQRLEQERQEQEQRTAVPTPPSPYDSAFAALREFMSEMLSRVRRLEVAQQQPPRDPSLDVPASVTTLRRVFAGACKTLGFVRPTPAIIGRAMHAEKAFNRNAAKSPYALFDAIYRAVKHALGLPSAQLEASAEDTRDFVHLDADMVALLEGRSVRPQKKHSVYYNQELQPRLQLLKDTGLADVAENEQGQRKNYSRYLTPSGRELFNNWPEWTDATGGIGLAEEPAGVPPTQPERAGPDVGPTSPAT